VGRAVESKSVLDVLSFDVGSLLASGASCDVFRSFRRTFERLRDLFSPIRLPPRLIREIARQATQALELGAVFDVGAFVFFAKIVLFV
ncbi:MAG: hypothetical protein IJX36_06330, partial [Thermoguttaceae bacterium]|nr:hypothetical protein [Thermoguttaceae bacterium]